MNLPKLVILTEATDPDDMKGPDDLPKDIEDALPDGAEKMFYDELVKAKKKKPDEQEGVWYALAWDEVNDKYKKTDDGDWVKKESLARRVDSLIAESAGSDVERDARKIKKRGHDHGVSVHIDTDRNTISLAMNVPKDFEGYRQFSEWLGANYEIEPLESTGSEEIFIYR